LVNNTIRPQNLNSADPLGYISNEKIKYDICVISTDSGFEFAAIDEDGEFVEGVELPSDIDPTLVNQLETHPGSNFVYDPYGRRYKVVEMGSVDISDVDDMEYPYD
jgi:hypothetical protein